MSDTDLSDGIVSDELPQHIHPSPSTRTDFKPWHRVRKQFIREQQWNHEVRFLAQRFLRNELQHEETAWGESSSTPASTTEASTPENFRVERPLRCLVLPGDELLDIRSLWQELQHEGCYLRFLGFNNTIHTKAKRRQIDVAESAVTQLAKVCKNSQVTNDSFQAVAQDNSQAYSLFRRYGPYDLVNLDLCDSLVPRGKSGEMEAYYTAIHRLIHYQLQHQKTPWLLFATTQVDRVSANQPEINKLADPLRANCDKHPRFAEALAKLIPQAAFQGSEHKLNISLLTSEHLVRVFGVVLGKWLIGILSNASPRCIVKLVPSYRYTIKPESNVEMLSLGFLITPHLSPPVDHTGVSTLAPVERPFPDEVDSALGLISTAANISDVDQILAADVDLHKRLTVAKSNLLAAVGYDAERYIKWVADGERDAST